MSFELDRTGLEEAGDALVRQSGAVELAHAALLLTGQCHGAAVAAGWYTDLATGKAKVMNDGERAMLQLSELAEAMEGHRKKLKDDKLPDRSMLEVELADTVIRICDHAGYLDIKIGRCMASIYSAPWHPHPVADVTNVPERLLQIAKTLCDADSAGGTYSYSRDMLPFRGLHLALSLLLIGRLCRDQNLDLGGAIAEKMQFNAVRPDHKKEARQKAGGKNY